MPSHLAAELTDALVGGDAPGRVGPRRARRARGGTAGREVPGGPWGDGVPAMSGAPAGAAVAVLPQRAQLLAADADLDDGPLIPAGGARPGAMTAPRPLGPALPRQRVTAPEEVEGPRTLPEPDAGSPPCAPPAPAPLTRRARREVEQLEAALALPAAGTRQPAAGAHEAAEGADTFTPSRGPRPHRAPCRAAFGLPQVGMVGVLGIVTLVAPVAAPGAHATSESSTQDGTSTLSLLPSASLDLLSTVDPAPAGATAPVTPVSGVAVPDVAELLAKRAQAERASRAIGERALAEQAELDRAAQAAADLQALVAGCDGLVEEEVFDAGNGRLDTDALCGLWEPDDLLRPDAAIALAHLDLAFRAEFGDDLSITDSYRSYASQVAVKRAKPGLAAHPGTSQHGWGLAVDLGGGVQKGDRHYEWLAEHAPDFGWENPRWARRGGSGPYEPWHWEFARGRDGESVSSDETP